MTSCLGVIEAIKNNRRTNHTAVEQRKGLYWARMVEQRGSNINKRFDLKNNTVTTWFKIYYNAESEDHIIPSIIFKLLCHLYGTIKTKIESTSSVLSKIQASGNVDQRTYLLRSSPPLSLPRSHKFIIFQFLIFKFSNIDTEIEFVSLVLRDANDNRSKMMWPSMSYHDDVMMPRHNVALLYFNSHNKNL